MQCNEGLKLAGFMLEKLHLSVAEKLTGDGGRVLQLVLINIREQRL